MFSWRKFAELRWVKAHENPLQAHAHGQLVIIHRPARKLLRLEIACNSRSRCRALLKQFGGRVETFPQEWLQRFAYSPKSKPLKCSGTTSRSGVSSTAANGSPFWRVLAALCGRRNLQAAKFCGGHGPPLQ